MRQHTAAAAATTTRDTAFGPIARTSAALGLAVTLGAGSMLLGASSATAAEGKPSAPIGEWSPNATKGVLGSSLNKQTGPHQDSTINGLGILAGQSVKYEVQADLNGDPSFSDSGATMEIRDELPEGLTADIEKLSIYDLRTGDGDKAESALLPKSQYTVTDEEGVLTIAFDADWVEANVAGGADGRLAIVFDATSAEDIESYTSLENTAEQVFVYPSSEGNEDSPEERVYPTKAATVEVAGVSPTESLTYAGSDIGDKAVVGGDVLDASVTLDGTFGEEGPLDLAYDLKRFGIVDDYDESTVSVVKGSAQVHAGSEDVTGLFEVTDKGGELSVLLSPDEKSGAIDPSRLGQDYTVTYQVAVKDVKESGSIGGETVQVLGDTETPVDEEATAKVVALTPAKAAVAESGSTDALDEVAAQSEAWYRLTSSTIPANKLTDVETWSQRDAFTSGDRALHDAWAVHADTDILDADGEVLFAAGDVIDDQDGGTYFTVDYDGDSVYITATDAFLELVNSEQNAGNDRAWSVYTSATRTAEEGTRVSNTGHESLNGFSRSASVTTGTGAAADGSETPGEDPKDDDDSKGDDSEDPKGGGDTDEPKGDDTEDPKGDGSEDPKEDGTDGDKPGEDADDSTKDDDTSEGEKKQDDAEKDGSDADKKAEEKKQDDAGVSTFADDGGKGPGQLARTGADDGLMLAGAGGGLLMAAGSAAIGLSRRKGLFSLS